MEDDEIDGRSDDGHVAARPARAKPGPKAGVKLVGPLCVRSVFVSRCAGALWQNVFTCEVDFNFDGLGCDHFLLGFALGRWSLEPPPTKRFDAIYDFTS